MHRLIKSFFKIYTKYVNKIHLTLILIGLSDVLYLYVFKLRNFSKFMQTPYFIESIIMIPILLVCILKGNRIFCMIASVERFIFYIIAFIIPFPLNPAGLLFAEGSPLIKSYMFVITNLTKLIPNLSNISYGELIFALYLILLLILNYSIMTLLILAEKQVWKNIQQLSKIEK